MSLMSMLAFKIKISFIIYSQWLQKQADARKLTELPDEFNDLTDDEKNLDFLKEKAGYD